MSFLSSIGHSLECQCPDCGNGSTKVIYPRTQPVEWRSGLTAPTSKQIEDHHRAHPKGFWYVKNDLLCNLPVGCAHENVHKIRGREDWFCRPADENGDPVLWQD